MSAAEPTAQRAPALSVVVPFYNPGDMLARCVASVRASSFTDWELILVDDASDKAKIPPLPTNDPRVHLMCAEKQVGPGFARNLGAKSARSDVVVFIDADEEVHSDTLTLIKSRMDQHPEVDALFGSYDDEPSDSSTISMFKNLFHHFVHQRAHEVASTFWTGCGAIRRRVFEEFEGFRITHPFEDVELGFRMYQQGRQVRLYRDIQVKHMKQWTFWGLIKTDVFVRGIPWTLMMLEYKHVQTDLNLSHAQKASALFAMGLVTLLIAAVLKPVLLIGAAICALTIVLLNSQLYGFFVRKRGIGFAIAAFPFHVLYYLYSSFALAAGISLFTLKKLSGRRAI